MCIVGSVMAKYLMLEAFVGCWISCDVGSCKHSNIISISNHPGPGSLVHHTAKFS